MSFHRSPAILTLVKNAGRGMSAEMYKSLFDLFKHHVCKLSDRNLKLLIAYRARCLSIDTLRDGLLERGVDYEAAQEQALMAVGGYLDCQEEED